MSAVTGSENKKKTASGAVYLPDDFIDNHLARANGEFVKVYLCLLRHLRDADPEAPLLAALADVLSCTEGDVRRALRYWEKEGLLQLAFEGQKLVSVKPAAPAAKKATAAATQVSAARLRELRGQDEVRDLLYAAEVYKGGPLDQPYARTLLFFYDDLGFPADLVEYLVEYCVERGKNTTPYLRAVGMAWHEEGIRTLKAAKAHAKKFREEAAKPEGKATGGAVKKNRFNNFTQRMNDYDQMERELIRAQKKKK